MTEPSLLFSSQGFNNDGHKGVEPAGSSCRSTEGAANRFYHRDGMRLLRERFGYHGGLMVEGISSAANLVVFS